jgi:hypothetical protein
MKNTMTLMTLLQTSTKTMLKGETTVIRRDLDHPPHSIYHQHRSSTS